MLLFFGGVILISAQKVAQARIHYDGSSPPSMFSDRAGTVPAEVTEHSCPVSDTTCRVKIRITKDMEPPILVTYIMFPFYQNYFDYYNSIYWPELLGKKVAKDNALYNTKCRGGLATSQGERISPCGTQAKAFFNDTFRIEGIPLDETGLAWASDVRRFNNPPEYPEPQSSGWLYKRFPTIINETAGVKNEHFATWVRPDAYAEVRKPYAYIRQPLKAGQTITVLIDARYPVSQLNNNVRKELLLTTLSPFGGRDETFAWFLLFTGGLCIMVSFLVAVIEVLVRRFQSDDEEDEEETE